jgi:hypothetical protein
MMGIRNRQVMTHRTSGMKQDFIGKQGAGRTVAL